MKVSKCSILLLEEDVKRLVDADLVMASRASTRPFRCLTSSPERQEGGWRTRANHFHWPLPGERQVAEKLSHLTQSNESKEDAEEQQQAEQEAQEPLPPAAAGAEAQAGFFDANV